MNSYIPSSLENNSFSHSNDQMLKKKNQKIKSLDYNDSLDNCSFNFERQYYSDKNLENCDNINEKNISEENCFCNSDCNNDLKKEDNDTSIGSINTSELSICKKLHNSNTENCNDETKENSQLKYTYFDETLYNSFNYSKLQFYDNDIESIDTESIEFLIKDKKGCKKKKINYEMKFETCSTLTYFVISVILFVYHIALFYKNNKNIEIYKDFYNMKFELIETSLFMKYNSIIFKVLKLITVIILSSISFKLYILIQQRISVPELIHNKYNAKMFFIFSWLYALSSIGLLFYYEEISTITNLYIGFSDNIIFTFSIIFGYFFINYEYEIMDDIMLKSFNNDKLIIKVIENRNKSDLNTISYNNFSYYVLNIVKIFLIICKLIFIKI